MRPKEATLWNLIVCNLLVHQVMVDSDTTFLWCARCGATSRFVDPK